MAAGATSRVLGDQDAELGGGTGVGSSSTPVAVGYERPAGGSAQPAESCSSRGTCLGVAGSRPARGSVTDERAVAGEEQPLVGG